LNYKIIKSLLIFSLIVSFIVIVIPNTVRGATRVEGIIETNTTWTHIDSPYVVTNDIVVNPDVILTIDPGVEIRFEGEFSFIVNGRLEANGNEKSKVVFTSNNLDLDPQYYWFFTIKNSVVMNYCIVEYSISLQLYQGVKYARIENSEFRYCRDSGIELIGDINNVLVKNNYIHSIKSHDESTGIWINHGSPINCTFSNNTVFNCSFGFKIQGYSYDDFSSAHILKNLISSNTIGFVFQHSDQKLSPIIAENIVTSNDIGVYFDTIIYNFTNNLISHNGIGIYVDSGPSTIKYNDIYSNDIGLKLQFGELVAEYNYWGDPSGPYHISLNSQGKGNQIDDDNANVGFIPFLSESATELTDPKEPSESDPENEDEYSSLVDIPIELILTFIVTILIVVVAIVAFKLGKSKGTTNNNL
jgi:hypothetical protein